MSQPMIQLRFRSYFVEYEAAPKYRFFLIVSYLFTFTSKRQRHGTIDVFAGATTTGPACNRHGELSIWDRDITRCPMLIIIGPIHSMPLDLINAISESMHNPSEMAF